MFHCKQFSELTLAHKLTFVKSNNLCHNIRNCRSAHVRKICDCKHHTQLHNAKGPTSDYLTVRTLPEPSNAINDLMSGILKVTAMVRVRLINTTFTNTSNRVYD